MIKRNLAASGKTSWNYSQGSNSYCFDTWLLLYLLESNKFSLQPLEAFPTRNHEFSFVQPDQHEDIWIWIQALNTTDM